MVTPRRRAGLTAVVCATAALAVTGLVGIAAGATGGTHAGRSQPLPAHPFSIDPAVARHLPRPAAPTARAPGRCPPTSVHPSVQIRAQCIVAPIVDVGTDASGSLRIPGDVHLVGFDTQTAALDASVGTTVIAGHVDDRNQGAGALHDLYRTAPGTEITLTAADGRVSRWRAYRLTSVNKARLPADLFATTGPRRLVLVTCGGAISYLPGYGYSYADNVLVYATPE